MANEISKIKLPGSTTEYTVKDNSAITDITRSGTTFTATKRDGTTFTFTQQDNNTTYTFATGDNDGQIKVTPSGGTAQNVSVKGLGAAAYKGTTTSVTSGSSDLVTSGAVYTAIDNLPEPMIFKGSLGTGGTITTLPTASSANEGFTYKVITAGTYASQAAKVGDLFISNGTDWIWIPSGDEPSGTVTSVAAGTGLDGGTITTSGTLSVKYGTAAGTACEGNDSRLSDARTPTSHTHGNIQNGGTLQTNDITIASGDKLVVTDSSDSAKVARTSISFDGSTATKALTQKGTWETYTTVKVSNTDPSTSTYYYPTWSTTTSSTGELKANDGFTYHSLQGTTSSDGYGRLILGNAISTGTAGNKHGYITLYSHKSGTSTIIPAEDTEMHWTHTLPKVTGTIGVFSETPAGGQVIICSIGSNTGAIKPSGYTINASVPSNAVFTDTTYTLSADTTNNKIKLTPSSGSAQSITVPYATSAGSATDSTKLPLAGGTMTGALTMAGVDIALKTTGSSSDDSADITWYYGNGQEKARLWTANEYTAKSGLNYRVYKKDGTSLYTGTIPLADGTGASGTWGISVSGNAATATKATQDGDGNTIKSTYLKLSGGTMTGAITFANGIKNVVGDDSAIGDCNIGGTLGLIGVNGTTGLAFFLKDTTWGSGGNYAKFSYDGTSMSLTKPLNIQGTNGSWIVTGKSPTVYVKKSSGSGALGAYSVDTKTGRFVLSTYPSSDDLVYFNWFSDTTLAGTTNTVDKQFTWTPSTNTLSANISGTAAIANKLGSSNVGSATQPIYLNAGTATACTYSLNKTVPADAVFTDHTYNFSGTTFYSGNSSTAEHNCNNATKNGVYYYTSNGAATSIGASTNDGALYVQAYSDSWVGQICQDYRNGNLFTRGKNNGTWTDWRKVMYSNDTYGGTLTKSQVTTALGYTPPTSDTNNAVTQTATTTSANYELLFSGTADNTTRTEGARKTDSLKYNPSTKELTLDGTIVLNGYSRTTSTDPCPSIVLKANNIDTDTAVTARTYSNSEINVHDKDGDRLGFMNWFKDTDGSIGFALSAQNKSTGGTNYYNTLEMRVDKTGNKAYSVSDTKAFRTAINDTTITFTKSTTALSGNIGVTRKGNVCTITIGNQITTAGSYTQLGTISPKPAMSTHFLVALDGALRIMRVQADGSVVFNNATAVSANAWLIGSCTYITAD